MGGRGRPLWRGDMRAETRAVGVRSPGDAQSSAGGADGRRGGPGRRGSCPKPRPASTRVAEASGCGPLCEQHGKRRDFGRERWRDRTVSTGHLGQGGRTKGPCAEREGAQARPREAVGVVRRRVHSEGGPGQRQPLGCGREPRRRTQRAQCPPEIREGRGGRTKINSKRI